MRVLPLDLPEASLVPVVRGLLSEGERVGDLVRQADVDSVALSLSPEEMAALASADDLGDVELSLQEEVYVEALGRFGPVSMPPPCFVEGLRVAAEQDLPVFALDMDEEAFTDLYLESVGTLDLLRRSLRLRRLARRGVEAATPEELVRSLDAALTRPRAFRAVERAREAHMAVALADLCVQGLRPLALVEAERFEGVSQRFRRALLENVRSESNPPEVRE